MASSTTVNGFPVPLSDNTGWRTPDGSMSVLGDFRVSRFGEVTYQDFQVGTDANYGSDVLATATALTSQSDYATQAAAAIAAMP